MVERINPQALINKINSPGDVDRHEAITGPMLYEALLNNTDEVDAGLVGFADIQEFLYNQTGSHLPPVIIEAMGLADIQNWVAISPSKGNEVGSIIFAGHEYEPEEGIRLIEDAIATVRIDYDASFNHTRPNASTIAITGIMPTVSRDGRSQLRAVSVRYDAEGAHLLTGVSVTFEEAEYPPNSAITDAYGRDIDYVILRRDNTDSVRTGKDALEPTPPAPSPPKPEQTKPSRTFQMSGFEEEAPPSQTPTKLANKVPRIGLLTKEMQSSVSAADFKPSRCLTIATPEESTAARMQRAKLEQKREDRLSNIQRQIAHIEQKIQSYEDDFLVLRTRTYLLPSYEDIRQSKIDPNKRTLEALKNNLEILSQPPSPTGQNTFRRLAVYKRGILDFNMIPQGSLLPFITTEGSEVVFGIAPKPKRDRVGESHRPEDTPIFSIRVPTTLKRK